MAKTGAYRRMDWRMGSFQASRPSNLSAVGGPAFGSTKPHNRKRPAGEAGRFWGYYREERYVSLYMWIRGR